MTIGEQGNLGWSISRFEGLVLKLLIGLLNPQRVLDIGTGSGRSTQIFVDCGVNVITFDRQKSFLVNAPQKAKAILGVSAENIRKYLVPNTVIFWDDINKYQKWFVNLCQVEKKNITAVLIHDIKHKRSARKMFNALGGFLEVNSRRGIGVILWLP